MRRGWGRTLSRRTVSLALLTIVGIILWLQHPHGPHVLQPVQISPLGAGHGDVTQLTRAHVKSMCAKHNFGQYSRPRQVYDLFMISTELDWLEIRLNSLAPYVDYFVIVEGTQSFTGLPKPLHLKDNWDRFAEFHHKIIYRVVEDPGESIGSRTWDHEDYLRNAMFDSVFPSLQGTSQQAQLGDVILVSDADEIPRPETLILLRHCTFPARLNLRSQFFYYSFQWRHRGEEWAHPQATVYRGLHDTISPKDLRNGEGGLGWFFLGPFWTWWEKADLWNAGWHCSSCFATTGEMLTKMQSFSHTPLNTEQNRDRATMLERVSHGDDLFGRKTETYDRVDNNRDVPQYILSNSGKFSYMLNRDGPKAGFKDV